MVHLEQAQPEQLQELLAFAEEAFRTPEGKVDFPTLLPKLYGPGADSAPLHTVLYEDGAPAGLYCLKIQDFNIAGTALRVGGIGTVCVDGRSRGKGHLALLMQDAQERMQAAGCDIAMLGGQRQRYERFGYVPAGAHWEFTLTPRNVRDIRTGSVALAPLAEYPSWLESARALHEKQPVTCARGGDASFLTVLQSWRAEPYAVLQDGMFAGYCALAEGKPPRLQELVLPDAALLPAFAAALAQHTGAAGVRVQLYPWQRAELAYFASVAEQGVCVPNHSYRVFHWAAAARAAMALQRAYDDTAILNEFILEVENEVRLRFGPGQRGCAPRSRRMRRRTLCCRRWTPRVCCSGRTARWCPARRPFPPGCCRCRWPSPGRTAFEWGGRKPTLPAKAAAGRFPAGPLRKNSPLSSGCAIPEEGGLFAFRVLPDKAAAAVKESAFALHLCCAR